MGRNKGFFCGLRELIGIDMKSGTENWKLFFSHFFQFAQIGILQLSQKVGELWDNTIGVLNAIGEGIGSSLSGGDFTTAYANARNQTKKEAEANAKIYEATIAGIEKEITASENRIAAERKRIAEKYRNSHVGEGTQLTGLSPNHSGRRTHAIDRITPHAVVGQLSVERICGCFAGKDREASCNYAIGADGRIGLCVDEANRSWCSSSRDNDQRAVTIECASDLTEPYAMKPAVYAALVELCADICRRNDKKRLVWIADREKALKADLGDDEMLLTVHRWFAKKSCPGNWLMERLGSLADEVNGKL